MPFFPTSVHHSLRAATNVLLLAVGAFALLTVPGSALAQGPPPSGDTLAAIIGVIADSAGRPVYRAEVTIPALSRSTLTDTSGRFELGRLAPGVYVVRARRIGFEPGAWQATVRAGERAAFRIVMGALPAMLDRVVVSGREYRLPGVYDRLRKGIGVIRLAEDLAKFRHYWIDDVLKADPAMRIALWPPSCGVSMFIDGRKFPPFGWAGPPPPRLSDFVRTSDVEAVEVQRDMDMVHEPFINDLGSSAASCTRVVLVWTNQYGR